MPRRKGWADSTFQRLPLEALSIEALNKVLNMQRAYALEFQEYERRRAQNKAEKKSLESALSSAEQQGNDVQEKIIQLYAQLTPFEVGVIGKWLFSEPTIKFGGRCYRPDARPLVDKLDQVYKQWGESDRLKSSLQEKLRNFEVDKPVFQPKREEKLRYQSQTFIFDIGVIDLERIERIVEKKKSKAALEEERERSVRTKVGQTKAKAAAYENKQRELAKSIRTALRKELKDNPYCPYCNLELSLEDAHADHIHPVVKGGLSTIRNMVFVCPSCNIEKGTLTLRAFLKNMDYVKGDVYGRLELMRKDV